MAMQRQLPSLSLYPSCVKYPEEFVCTKVQWQAIFYQPVHSAIQNHPAINFVVAICNLFDECTAWVQTFENISDEQLPPKPKELLMT